MGMLDDFRAQNPAYNDMPDSALALALHKKFYSDMPIGDFNQKIGLAQAGMPDHASMNAKTQRDLDMIGAGMNPDNPLPDSVNRFGQGIMRGVVDPSRAIAQVLSRTLDDSEHQRNFNTNLNEHEKQYQAGRTALGGQGLDAGRLTGNVAATLPVAAAIPATTSVLGGAAAGALSGAAGGALEPAYGLPDGGEGFGGAKAKQAGVGALGGAVVGGALSTLGKIIGPTTPAASKTLRSEGVELTPGQTIGGMGARIEEGLTSMPLVGDKIKEAQLRTLESYNKTAVNKALGQIGESVPADIPAGHAAIKVSGEKISGAYDALMPQLTATVDAPFGAQLQTAFRDASMLPKERADQFRKILTDKLAGKIDPTTGTISGDTLKRR
jgi:hypothetical protein